MRKLFFTLCASLILLMALSVPGWGALPVSDNFNRANENPLAGNWSTMYGSSSFQLTAYLVKTLASSPPCVEYWNADAFAVNHYSQITYASNTSVGPAVRIDTSGTAANCYAAKIISTTSIQIIKIVAGAALVNVGTAFTISPALTNETIKLAVTGTTLELFVAGVSQGTQSDSSISTGAPGIYGDYTNRGLDNFVADNTVGPPSVTTTSCIPTSATTATGTGNVTSAGGGTISERGFVINLTGNPTIADTKFTTSGTTGVYTVDLTSLVLPGTHYYARAFATNEYGTEYGDQVEFPNIYYFDPVLGLDATGTPNNINLPYQTASKLNTLLNGTIQAGDYIKFKCNAGANFETNGPLTLGSTSGVSGCPVIFTSYGTGAKPVLCGLYSVANSGWSDVGGGVYSKAIADTNWLYEDGLPIPQDTDTSPTDGKWYNDSGTIYYNPTGATTPADHTLQRSNDAKLFRIGSGTNYLTFDGLEFLGEGIVRYKGTGTTTGITITNCDFPYNYETCIKGDLDWGERLILDNYR